MDTHKRIFNHRAFVAIMAVLTGLALPITGLVLHVHSHRGIRADGHVWFTLHVLGAALFIVFVTWHIVLNRRPFLKHLKSTVAGRVPLSREAILAVLITAALFIILIIQSH